MQKKKKNYETQIMGLVIVFEPLVSMTKASKFLPRLKSHDLSIKMMEPVDEACCISHALQLTHE